MAGGDDVRAAFSEGQISRASALLESARVDALNRKDLSDLEALRALALELQRGTPRAMPRSWSNALQTLDQNIAYVARAEEEQAPDRTVPEATPPMPASGTTVPFREPSKRAKIVLCVAGGVLLVILVIVSTTGGKKHSKTVGASSPPAAAQALERRAVSGGT